MIILPLPGAFLKLSPINLVHTLLPFVSKGAYEMIFPFKSLGALMIVDLIEAVSVLSIK